MSGDVSCPKGYWKYHLAKDAFVLSFLSFSRAITLCFDYNCIVSLVLTTLEGYGLWVRAAPGAEWVFSRPPASRKRSYRSSLFLAFAQESFVSVCLSSADVFNIVLHLISGLRLASKASLSALWVLRQNKRQQGNMRLTLKTLLAIGAFLDFALCQYNVYRQDPFAVLSRTLLTYQQAACDGTVLNLVCPPGTKISIQLVQYGRTAPSTEVRKDSFFKLKCMKWLLILENSGNCTTAGKIGKELENLISTKV